MTADSHPSPRREGPQPIGDARLYVREIGHGAPLIVLHGGPDFDHGYLLPEMDRLADSFRLIYYDQRGRGRSAGNVHPDDVSIESEAADLEAIRQLLGTDSVALLGHSWGGLLAAEYAVRHPERVSHLVLMNTAPVSREGFLQLVSRERPREDREALTALRATAEFQAGDLDAEAAYYRVHFRHALYDTALVESVVSRLRRNFTPETVLKARAIEERLYRDTWLREDYDLLPALAQIPGRILVLHGDSDLVPAAIAERIAAAVPDARFVMIEGCGHFAYMERPERVREELLNFFERAGAQSSKSQ